MNSVIFLPTANEVCEGYVFTGVCLSMGRGAGCLPRWLSATHTPWDQRQTPPRADTPLGRHLRGQTPPSRHSPGQIPLGRHPPAQWMLGYTPLRQILKDTVNKRAVRILLERIFVVKDIIQTSCIRDQDATIQPTRHKQQKTRMHSSKMRTARSNSRPGGVSTRHPPGPGTPLGADPREQPPSPL